MSVGDKDIRIKGFLLITAGTDGTAKAPFRGVGREGGLLNILYF